MLVTFLPINIKIQAKAGSNLFHLARENGIDLGGVCSGNKTCGKCKVLITKGNSLEFLEEELKTLTEEERNSGIRLACCFSIFEDTCVILCDNNQRADNKSNDIRLEQGLENDDLPGLNKYGIALDIGTTTVVAQLWDLNTKDLIGEISTLNPQSLYGADVVARISFAVNNPDNCLKLTKLIREGCDELILKLAENYRISYKDIVSVVAVGNTTMTHLFLGRSVDSLAKIPFQGVSYEGEERKPSDMNFDINENGSIYIMPGIGGHVGSDTLGCILSSNLVSSRETVLLVDIGTNGEIVLAHKGSLTVCSTAAGPAFEGASLYQGMRAEKGAITKVKMEEGNIIIDYIGSELCGVKPKGICGSGIIEAMYELYKNGIIDASGRLTGQAGEINYITIWKENNEEVRITQKDIREIQLAKGAIYAGINILLKKEGIDDIDLDKIYLAGAFGSNVNMKKAIHIGLLPFIKPGKISYIGNGAINGAAKLLLGKISRNEAEKTGKLAKHLELALCDEFQEEFIKAISFP